MTEIFYDKNAEVDKDGEKQDLGVYEARRLIGPQSFDDNWQLIGNTSELRNEKDNSFLAFVDFEGDEGSIRECPHCLEYDFHHKLYARVKKTVGLQRRMMTCLARVMNVVTLCLSIRRIMNQK
jgi:hypothetical protein